MDGVQPAHVPDGVIEDIRRREIGGAVELPKRQLRRGDALRILAGPFSGHLGLYDGMAAHERIMVLLSLFGAQRRVVLAKDNIEVMERAVNDRLDDIRSAR